MLEKFNQRPWYLMNINENIKISRSNGAFLHRNDIKIMLSVLKEEKVPFLHEEKMYKEAYLEIYKEF